MSDKKTKQYKSKIRILKLLSLIFIAVILISFLHSLIGLIIEPTSVCIVENRKNL